MSASRHSSSSATGPWSMVPVWPLRSVLAMSLVAVASLACTPGTSIGTDDYITGHERSSARVTFHMSASPLAVTNAPAAVQRPSVVLPIRAIVLSGASGEAVVYTCPAQAAHACDLDVADDAALAALFQLPVDVPAGRYDAVLFRSANDVATVSVGLSSPVTLFAGDELPLAVTVAPEQLAASFAVAALMAPAHQAATR